MTPAVSSSAPPMLYARHEHGGHPVRETTDGYSVDWPAGSEVYPSRRALMRALYSGGDSSTDARDPGISYSRYFRLDGRGPTQAPIFDLLGLSDQINVRPTQIRMRARRRTSKLTVAPQPTRSLRTRAKLRVEAPWFDGSVMVGGTRPLPPAAWKRPDSSKPSQLTVAKPKRARKKAAVKLTVETPSATPKLGIDLAARGHEVRKLVYAGFRGRIYRMGYDMEDVLQEIYRGLLARNIGKCPFDATKSSFGHYVHMVAECVLRNFMRKQRRIAQFEQIGVYTATEGSWGMVDAASMASLTSDDSIDRIEEKTSTEMAMGRLSERIMETGRPEAVLAVLSLPHVREGCQRREVADRVSVEIGETVKPTEIGKALHLLRAVSREWASEQGLRAFG